MNCKNCGFKNEEQAKFCKNCGTKLEVLNQQTISNKQDEYNNKKRKSKNIVVVVIIVFLIIGFLIVNFSKSIILDVMNDTNNESKKNMVYTYTDAVEKASVDKMIEDPNTKLLNGKYIISDNGKKVYNGSETYIIDSNVTDSINMRSGTLIYEMGKLTGGEITTDNQTYKIKSDGTISN